MTTPSNGSTLIVPGSFRFLGETGERGVTLGAFAYDEADDDEPSRFFIEGRKTQQLFATQRICFAFEHLRISHLYIALYRADRTLEFMPVHEGLVYQHLRDDFAGCRYDEYTAHLKRSVDALNVHSVAVFERLYRDIAEHGFDKRFPILVEREHRPEVDREITHVIDGQHRLAVLFHLFGDISITVLRVGRQG